ncbi:MAG TPA: acyltransferase [Tepidisphaeraceae bacterium]|jgi:peptidoglycan/LPS O-acetylase OafA/YrhL|nr:acyltransferase [Tepidisphaeraceae bacterium]
MKGKDVLEKRFIQTSESRENNLDILRFFLACVVIHSHSYMLTGHEYFSLRQKFIHLQFGGGSYAVDFFFMLSGFLVVNSWLRSRGLFDYLKRRTLRIYPGFIVCLALCVFVAGPLGGADLKSYFQSGQTYTFFRPLILGPLGTLPGVFTNAPWPGEVNVPLWTIRFEFLCYLFLAAIGMAGLLRKRTIVLGLFIAAAVFFTIQKHGQAELTVYEIPLFGAVEQIPRFVAFFLAGVAFYLYRDVIPQSGLLALVSLFGIAVATALHAFEPGLTIFGTYLIFYTGFHPKVHCHHFAKHGDFSYGMYLYGFVAQQLLVRHVAFARHPLQLTALALCAALTMAFLSWHLVEKPFLKLKRKSAAPREKVPMNSPEAAQAVLA